MDQNLIKLDGVKKVFYTDEVETHALGGIHLEIVRGEYVSIAGPSGCGKSTLLSIFGLLDTPTGGEYWLNGKPVANLTMRERARTRNREIGFIFQNFNLIGDLTVFDNVELPLTYRGMPSAERRKRVQDALERVGHGASREALSQPALGRPAAARRRCARRRGRAVDPAGGRADRQPGLEERRSGDGAASRAASRRRDALHGDARSALRAPRRSHDPSVRRPDRRREHGAEAESGDRVYERIVTDRDWGSGIRDSFSHEGPLMQHLPQALRALVRTPGFTIVVVLVLALGIGANTAIFSVVDAALLKPMPIPDADRVVRLSHGSPQSFVWFNRYGFQVLPEIRRTASFDAVGAYFTGELSVFGSGAGRVRATAVTPEFFDVLKVYPAIGRPFRIDDLDRSRHLVIITHGLWQTRLDGAKDVLDRQIVLNGESFDIIGVMPRGFELPEASDIWVPAAWGGRVAGGRLVAPVVMARLARGVTASEASEEIARTPHHGHARCVATGISIHSLRNTLVGDARVLIFLLAAGALIVLLVACTNIASLLLTRVSARQREFAVRRALGASERDIARQILAETLLLSSIAFIATIPIALWTLDAIRAWVPIRMHGAADIALDGRAVMASAAFSLLTGAGIQRRAIVVGARACRRRCASRRGCGDGRSAVAAFPQRVGGGGNRLCARAARRRCLRHQNSSSVDGR